MTGLAVDDWGDIRMHVECFDVWDSESRALNSSD